MSCVSCACKEGFRSVDLCDGACFNTNLLLLPLRAGAVCCCVWGGHQHPAASCSSDRAAAGGVAGASATAATAGGAAGAAAAAGEGAGGLRPQQAGRRVEDAAEGGSSCFCWGLTPPRGAVPEHSMHVAGARFHLPAWRSRASLDPPSIRLHLRAVEDCSGAPRPCYRRMQLISAPKQFNQCKANLGSIAAAHHKRSTYGRVLFGVPRACEHPCPTSPAEASAATSL